MQKFSEIAILVPFSHIVIFKNKENKNQNKYIYI